MELLKKFLSENRININVLNRFGYTPLITSIVDRLQPEVTLCLLQEGADVTISDEFYKKTPLHFAVQTKHYDVILEIINKGADIDAIDELGYTALHEAVNANNYEAVCMLLYYNANANILRKDLMSPFMLATYKNVNIEIQRLLMNYEADIHRLNSNGYNAFLLALKAQSEIAVDLLECGCDVNTFVRETSALTLAIQYDHHLSFIKKILSQVDYSVIRRNNCDPILFTLLIKMMEKEKWYELLETLIYSKEGEEIVQHCAEMTEDTFLSRLFQKFLTRQISHDKLLPIVETCLSYGIDVYVTDIAWIYENFGNCEILRV